MSNPRRAELFSLWSIQEALLQSYRSLFISVQAVLFALAAGVFSVASDDSDSLWALWAMIWAGVGLLMAWVAVTRPRAWKTSWVQWTLGDLEKGRRAVRSPYSEFREFEKDWRNEVRGKPALRKAALDPTRRIMETALPALFALLWAVLAGLTLVLKYEDLDWGLRVLRVLPVGLVFAVSALVRMWHGPAMSP